MSRSQSILFVLGRWSIGGVERVSVVLANEFARRGCDVAVAAFGFDNKRLLENLDARVAVIELSDGWYTEANRRRLRSAVEERKVAVIINQWCLPFRTTRFLRKAVKGLGVRIVAVHHNKPDVNNRICGAGNVFARTFWRIVSRVNLHLVYGSCDAYVLLSKSFEDVFCRFACIRDRDKLHCISNPLTIAPVDAGAKENILLYVGRLEETQKKVSRLLEAWSVLARDFPDWRLAIVGDGPDRSFYEGMARTLARVEFYGYEAPERHYAKAKILALTSDFEGFPLVLAEAMASGCVPVALGSYDAVFDIIDGESCGRICPVPFDKNFFAGELAALMRDGARLAEMAGNAKRRAEMFSTASVADSYENLFDAIGCRR